MIETHGYIARVFYDDGRPTQIIAITGAQVPVGHLGPHLEIWWHCPHVGAARVYPDPNIAALTELKTQHDRLTH